jgi:hypothetical protein
MPAALTPPNLIYVETRVGGGDAAAVDQLFSHFLHFPRRIQLSKEETLERVLASESPNSYRRTGPPR